VALTGVLLHYSPNPGGRHHGLLLLPTGSASEALSDRLVPYTALPYTAGCTLSAARPEPQL